MKTLLLFLSLIVTTSQAATVRLYFTDPLTNDKDTNAFYITPIGTNVLSSGGVVGRGVTTRYVPASNGYRTNTLAVGHYSITNRSLGSGVVIRVPDSSSLYDYTNILVSGYNIFVTITNGDSGTSGALTNNDTRAVTLTNLYNPKIRIVGAGDYVDFLTNESGAFSLATDNVTQPGLHVRNADFYAENIYATAGIFSGSGSGLTSVHGSNSISAGTISTNRMDATAYAAFNNDVTQSGLAAGSYADGSTTGASHTNNINWVNSVFVSASRGTNATAQRGNPLLPYSSIAAANAAANMYDTIVVIDGTFIEQVVPRQNIPFYLSAGVTITNNAATISIPVSITNLTIGGRGSIQNANTFAIESPSTNILTLDIEAESIYGAVYATPSSASFRLNTFAGILGAAHAYGTAPTFIISPITTALATVTLNNRGLTHNLKLYSCATTVGVSFGSSAGTNFHYGGTFSDSLYDSHVVTFYFNNTQVFADWLYWADPVSYGAPIIGNYFIE